MRAFLAIDLPMELKKKLWELKEEVPPQIKIKWVELPNFHITLKFFGNISESFLEKIFKESENIIKNYQFFQLMLDQLGFFPKKKIPRVVWIGLKTQDETLFDLQKALQKIFKKLKINSEKEEFHPHITLFRVKSIENLESFKDYFEKISKKTESLKGLNFPVKELVFFKSTLLPTGPLYEPLYKIPLKNV